MLSSFLITLIQRTPILLVVLAGMLFAIIHWRRHPRASLLVLIGFVIYVIKIVAFTALNYWLPTLRESMHLSSAAINNLYTVLDVFNDIVFALVVLILVVAAFSKRQPVAPAI